MGRWAPPEIISAARMGDESAAEQLVAAVWPGCFRLAAAQEACIAVYRKIRTLRNVDAFEAWLYRIVMHEAARARRRRDVVAETIEQSECGDNSVTIDVWHALTTLSPQHREVTVLFYFNDLKTDDIASILRIPHATVRTRLARARERLRGLLGDYEAPVPTPRETK